MKRTKKRPFSRLLVALLTVSMLAVSMVSSINAADAGITIEQNIDVSGSVIVSYSGNGTSADTSSWTLTPEPQTDGSLTLTLEAKSANGGLINNVSDSASGGAVKAAVTKTVAADNDSYTITYYEITADDSHNAVPVTIKGNITWPEKDTTVGDIENAYKSTDELDDADKEDETQKNYQKADGSTDDSYLLKSAEWTDKKNGKASITLTASTNKVPAKTTAVYAMDTCTVHGFSKAIAKTNLEYLLKHYDHVDVLMVAFESDGNNSGKAGTDTIKSFTDVKDTSCLDEVTFGPARHAASDIASALETYLFGSHGSSTQVNSPTAIFTSMDNDIGYDMSTLPVPTTDAFWNLLAGYDKEGHYFSMASCDRSTDDIADTSGRIADPAGYTTGTLPTFVSKNAALSCSVSNNSVGGILPASSLYSANALNDQGTLTSVKVNGADVSISNNKASGTTAVKPTITASAEGTYGGKYKVSLTSTNISAGVLEDFLLPNSIMFTYGYSNTANSMNSLYYEITSVKVNGTAVDLKANPTSYTITDANVDTAYNVEIVGSRKANLYHGAANVLYSKTIEDAFGDKADVAEPSDITISDTVSDNFKITNVKTNNANLKAATNGNTVTAAYASYPGKTVLQVTIDVELKDPAAAENLDKWLATNSSDAEFDYGIGSLDVSSPLLYFGTSEKTTTETPTTEAPSTDAPTTGGSSTETPTTGGSSTETPTTETPATGTTTMKSTSKQNSSDNGPNTSDNTNLVFWIVLITFSAAGFAAVIFLGRKKKKV